GGSTDQVRGNHSSAFRRRPVETFVIPPSLHGRGPRSNSYANSIACVEGTGRLASPCGHLRCSTIRNFANRAVRNSEGRLFSVANFKSRCHNGRYEAAFDQKKFRLESEPESSSVPDHVAAGIRIHFVTLCSIQMLQLYALAEGVLPGIEKSMQFQY